MTEALPERARALIDCWFGPAGDPEREKHRPIWFRSTQEHDDMLRRLFLADYEMAAAGRFASWEEEPLSALALVLLLDQIPRNVFRGDKRTYATDAQALAVAGRALERGFDAAVPPCWRKFFYMPLVHSERLADQQRGTALMAAVPEERDPNNPERGGLRRYGIPYLEVIARFGRFPHRNAILGRESTAEETAFLEDRARRRKAEAADPPREPGPK